MIKKYQSKTFEQISRCLNIIDAKTALRLSHNAFTASTNRQNPILLSSTQFLWWRKKNHVHLLDLCETLQISLELNSFIVIIHLNTTKLT